MKPKIQNYGLSLLTAGAALYGVTANVQAADKKPNILILWGDDIGGFNISAYNMGMMGYKTPNIDRLAKEGFRPDAIEVGRFKGLGEMNPEQLRETAMAPATRRVLPVMLRPDTGDDTLKLFNLLMGKGEASSRRAWMEAKGHLAEADI